MEQIKLNFLQKIINSKEKCIYLKKGHNTDTWGIQATNCYESAKYFKSIALIDPVDTNLYEYKEIEKFQKEMKKIIESISNINVELK